MIVNNVDEQTTTHSFKLSRGILEELSLKMEGLVPQQILMKLVRDRCPVGGEHMSEDEVNITVYHVGDWTNSMVYECEVELAGNPYLINQMTTLDLNELLISESLRRR